MLVWILSKLGLKQIAIAVTVFGVIVGSFLLIRYIQNSGQANLKIEQLEQSIQTRGSIDEAIRNSPSSVDDAIRLLERRQNSRD